MKTKPSRFFPKRSAFTLVEVLVSMAVLTLLVVMIAKLVSSAATVTGMGNKHMDADSQARALLDRMSADIAGMVRRSDVDYYLKGRPASNNQQGAVSSSINDQIAFYSEVSGYYNVNGTPSPAPVQSPVSLVAYRLNSGTYRMERLCKGLSWNGGPSTSPAPSPFDVPVVFLPIPLASPLPSPLPSPMPSPVPTPAWPQAADSTASDNDYEAFGPQVFRFEYYYILKGQSVSVVNSSILSNIPWDTRAPANHTSVNGLKDVAAIGVAIAVIDPASQVLVGSAQLQTLAGQMNDFAITMKPGDLEAQWKTAVNASALTKISAQGIRIYGRTFYLNPPPP